MTRTRTAALALACLPLLTAAAYAAEVVTKGDTAVIVPVGEYVTAAAQTAEPVVITAVTSLVGIVLARFFPLARLFLTDRVVEAALWKWMDYGINAVAGAAKDKVLSFDIGSSVLSQAVNRALDRATLSKQGAILLDKAGGPAEVAAKLFRMLHLDETGSDAILTKVLADLRAAGQLK